MENWHRISTRIVTRTDWIMLTHVDVAVEKYTLACYTAQNGSHEKLVQIAYLPIVHQSSDPTFASLQMTYSDSVYLSYDEITQTLDVLFYDVGPVITGLRLGLKLPGGSSSQTVFISKKLEANLHGFNQSSDTLNSAVALVPYLNTTYDLWSLLVSSGVPTQIGVTENYEDTYEKQKTAYGDDVQRAIAGDIEQYEMRAIGHRFHIEGRIYAGYPNCTVLDYWYRATAV